jgi:muconolactone delta-isomerase
MKFLVVGLPKHQIPPEQLPGVIDGAIAWSERYQGKLDAFGMFPGGGGFGIADVSDETELNQMIIDMPFTWFSDVEVRPFVEGNAGLQQLKQAVEAMAAMA